MRRWHVSVCILLIPTWRHLERCFDPSGCHPFPTQSSLLTLDEDEDAKEVQWRSRRIKAVVAGSRSGWVGAEGDDARVRSEVTAYLRGERHVGRWAYRLPSLGNFQWRLLMLLVQSETA